MKKRILLLIGSLIASHGDAQTIQDHCLEPNALLNLINRPSNADGPCVVPFKKVLIEAGYQYQTLINPAGIQNNLPNLALRLGLPGSNEILMLIPNYIHQSYVPKSGDTATTLGMKHQFHGNKKWLLAGESYVTPPSGSAAFGSAGMGLTLNGIANYMINDQFSITAMLGVSTQTLSKLNAGRRYNSMNPDLVVSYALLETLNIYFETYGQNHTAPNQGWGANADFGILYLINPALVIDVEMGQRLSGNLGGFERYIGAGISTMLG